MKQKRKIWMYGALMGALLLSLTACGKSQKGKQGDAVDALADGVLTVGIIDGEDGFARKADGEFHGIEPTILNAFASGNEVKIEYVEMQTPAELFEALNAGRIDLAAGRLTKLETLSNVYLRSISYANRGIYLMSSENLYVDSLSALGGSSIGVSSWIPEEVLTAVPGIDKFQTAEVDSDASAAISGEAMVKSEFLNTGLSGILYTEREAMKAVRENQPVHVAELYNSPRMGTVFYMAPGQENLQQGINGAINGYLDSLAGGK